FDEEFETADCSETHHGRRRNGQNECVLETTEFLVERRGYGWTAQIMASPFFKWFQSEENDAGIGRHTEAADAQAGKSHRILNAGLFQSNIRHLADDCLGAVERRRVRQLGESDEILFVLRRHETGWDFVEAPGS